MYAAALFRLKCVVAEHLLAVAHAHVRLVLHLQRIAAEDHEQSAGQLEGRVAVEHERGESNQELAPNDGEYPVEVVGLSSIGSQQCSEEKKQNLSVNATAEHQRRHGGDAALGGWADAVRRY